MDGFLSFGIFSFFFFLKAGGRFVLFSLFNHLFSASTSFWSCIREPGMIGIGFLSMVGYSKWYTALLFVGCMYVLYMLCDVMWCGVGGREEGTRFFLAST